MKYNPINSALKHCDTDNGKICYNLSNLIIFIVYLIFGTIDAVIFHDFRIK